MKPIDVLGLKNFRIFDDQTGIFQEMAPINILTGANNSGKTSIIKALQLIKNSVKGNFPFELDLTEQEHSLGDFENVLHNKANKGLSVSLPFSFLGLTKLYISLTFEVLSDDNYKAKLRKIEVIDRSDNLDLFVFSYREATRDEIKEDALNYQKELKELEQRKNNLQGIEQSIFGANFGLFAPFEDPLSGYVEWSINSGKLKGYLIQLLEVYKSYLAYKHKSGWLDHADALLNEKSFPLLISTFIKSFKNDVSIETWEDFAKNILTEGKIEGAAKIGEHDFEPDDYFFPVPQVEDILYYKALEILRTKLKWKNNDDEDSTYDVIEHSFKSSWEGLRQRILSINYLSTIREQNSRIYNVTNNSPFVNLLKDYNAQQYDRNSFLNRYLREFEIGDSLVIDYKPDYQLIFASVKSADGEKRELVDFGYGIKQLILLLIQISVLSQKNGREKQDYDEDGNERRYNVYDPSLLLIEEPETNLHPKWQSLLAKMFVEANQKYNIQFIIESHSEYMIRKFQTLVAEKAIQGEGIRIFYLRDRKSLCKNKKQVEFVKIQDDGSIDYQIFDGGFFDESDNLEFSLLNINFTNDFQVLKAEKAAGDVEIYDLEQKIDKYIAKLDINGYRQIVMQLFDITKLSETSVIYLTSAQYFLGTIHGATDFSPVIIQYGRTIEHELKNIFSKIPAVKDGWSFGSMQAYLEKYKTGKTKLKMRTDFDNAKLNMLKNELINTFTDPKQLKIDLIHDLRLIRNAAGHGGETKNMQEAQDYISKANEFLSEWVARKKT